MSQTNQVEQLSVRALFDSKTQYVIPIYQRNYAWGPTEIEQLIQDISDAAGLITQSDETATAQQAKYYLGSLVVYQRTNHTHQTDVVYETIDGQQRHTTLSILLAYLKHREVLDTDELEGLDINLTFDSRPKSSRALNDIYTGKTNSESEEPNIHAAFNIIQRYFKTKGLDADDKTKQFFDYLLESVTILRVVVPPQTDLNHYFEIMNNRGEQLEKHEVLKAKFMGTLSTDEERSCFSTIWDACSNMKRYTQMGFQSDLRKEVFGDDWQTMPHSFEAIQDKHTSKQQKQDAMTLREIIANKTSSPNDDEEEREKEERFGTVIDFSNFLLHVLKLMKTEENVSLDDKKLIDAFVSKDHGLRVGAKDFVYELLKYRVLFDSYVIKPDQHDEKRKWSLLRLNAYKNGNSLSPEYPNAFSDHNEKIRMILAMFHVSNPALVYKRWLNDALRILNSKTSDKARLEVDGSSYLTELEALSKSYFDEIRGDSKLAFSEDNVGVLHQGTGVQNFVFNRLDYLLWSRMLAGDSFGGQKKDEVKEHFNDFQFAFRTSVEHHFPQTDPSGASKMKDVDRFGNLCLISPSSNSRLSNYSPQDKKKFYQENNRTESLKQAIMMSYDEWGPEGEGHDNILKHEAEMIKVLCNQ
ncbi:TPA: DUF262 domain-containing protein [Vibrio parahaemolyticus]|uniref:DUF262 domain-containing protein n=1 Tax=Vibrio parahaemolyticus TaxID=670 RepID=UPI0004244C01|nr:DUF262 domain-containing protein [Vibrio parahaemolyticus]EJG2371826.1 DUF262 domain-containing protein [Vibrio parahaemolyticus]TPA08891.1 DUF262 domain-containing protein [Vibrio parahaemolyticus]HBC3602918.1 DUF262 domain-containing protein [Vibrio parahaemolyticus]HCG5934728.1 DUF262 domain-containing protein [Vibrio parahaemolyticus]HCH1626836.1 DUF262 domain-containing protein [Vibrio parahaemolyticus]